MGSDTEIWVDTDMGFDDLWAVLVLQVAGVKIAGMSLVAGNTDIDQVHRNTLAAAGRFDWTWPIHRGAECGLNGERVTAQRVLGPLGMRSRGEFLPSVELPTESGQEVEQVWSDWLLAAPQREILALGPLTNVAKLLTQHPRVVDHVGQVIWMGGAIGKGNATAAAEFNAFADPEAVAVVCRSGVPIIVVPLDVCRKVTVTEADVSAVCGEDGHLLGDLLGGYLDLGRARGRDSMAVYDPVAAAVVLAEEWFTLQDAALQVVTSAGADRGRTMVRLGEGSNVRVATDVEHGRCKELCLGALQRFVAGEVR